MASYSDGIKSRSAARCATAWEDEDNVRSVNLTDAGLVFRVENRGARGRDHEITISFDVLDHIARSRHQIESLKQTIQALNGRLHDVVKLARGEAELAEPEEELTDA